MRKLIFTFILLSAGYLLFGQCPPGEVNLESQADVDAFVQEYPNCTTINGSLNIGTFGVLNDITDVSGLSSITSAGYLQLTFTSLTSLNGLHNITNLAAGLNFVENKFLTSFSEMENLQNAGEMLIQGAKVENLHGFEGITNLTGELFVFMCPNLTSLSGLDNLTYVENIGIVNNPNLTDLDALSNLTQMSFEYFELLISGNNSLTSLAGLENVDYDGTPADTGGILIGNNPQLTFCNVPFICNYLAKSPSTHPRQITGNAGACEDEDSVTDACAMGLYEMNSKEFSFYPNPAQDVIYFKNTVSKLNIFNVEGKLVKSFNKEAKTFSLSGLPSGVYIVSYQDETGKRISKKMIKS